MNEALTHLEAGQPIVYGGDRIARVPEALAAEFAAGDRLVVVHSTGDLLHVPAAEHHLVDTAVTAAVDAFAALGGVSDEQITAFFDCFATRLGDDSLFAAIAAANEIDVSDAAARGRATGRLELSPAMRSGMISGLQIWRDSTTRRSQQLDVIDHPGWSVSSWRSPLGVVGFVFEGRPNVFADATGVLRTGNTVVFRIGSDALRTAQAIMIGAVAPALAEAGLPAGCVQLIGSPQRAAGWALFADARLSLAVARGSGSAVEQLGAVARQHGVPVSLHGTGGAWLVVDSTADPAEFAAAVENSMDRKVCNTLNVCCVVAEPGNAGNGGGAGALRADGLIEIFRAAADRAAGSGARGAAAIIHELSADDDRLSVEWEWDKVPEVSLVVVEHLDQAIELFNRFSPRLAVSLLSSDARAHERFYNAVDAPFVGNGFTRWVDGQFALDQPELGLSNWQHGRLFGRSAVLSGDSVHTIRMRAAVHDHGLHR
ncbi:MAG: aldehyde dehydrogenase family protein [Ilumatobacteraceae bacterium]